MSFAFAERGPPGPLLRALILEEDALKAVHPHHDLPPDSDAAVVPRHQGCFADKTLSEETYKDLLARDTMMQPSTLK